MAPAIRSPAHGTGDSPEQAVDPVGRDRQPPGASRVAGETDCPCRQNCRDLAVEVLVDFYHIK